jgi:hypothetical protein
MEELQESAHSRFRERLLALSTDDVPLRAIAEVDAAAGVSRQSWVRTYARFDPHRDPFTTIVLMNGTYPQTIFRVDAYRARPAEGPGEAILPEPAAGWLRITRFPRDPQLPTLASVLAGPGRRTVVRYHPNKRCTILVEEPGRSLFAKVFSDARGQRIYASGQALWRAACEGELRFSVARPDRFDRPTRTLWESKVDGAPVRERLFSHRGADLAHRIGQAAGSLPRSGLRPCGVNDAKFQLARSVYDCNDLARRVPRLGPALSKLLGELRKVLAGAPGSSLHPIHGDLNPPQWLEGRQGLGLVDFDKLALGNPELDAGTFLGEVDFQNRKRVPVDEINSAFLAGYENETGTLDRTLLRAYRAQKRLAMAAKVARAVRPDGDRKAERRVMRALRCLSGEPW